MVSNKSLEYSLSDKYKIYLFYACQNVAEAKKKLPLPLLKLSKNTIFWSKSLNKLLFQVLVGLFLYQTCVI